MVGCGDAVEARSTMPVNAVIDVRKMFIWRLWHLIDEIRRYHSLTCGHGVDLDVFSVNMKLGDMPPGGV
jgi:hypothetical protein